MNKQNEITLKHISTRARQYSSKVSDILSGFDSLVSQVKKEGAMRKDEKEFIAANTAKHAEATRSLLQKEQAAFASEVLHDAEEMKEQLFNSLVRPVNPVLVERLDIMKKYNLKPTRIEIEALLKMNGANLLGLRAIDSVLSETGADFSLKYHDIGDFESDLNTIEHLAAHSDHFVPLDMHHIGCEVYRGQHQTGKRADGKIYPTGYEWDSIALIQQHAAMNADVEKIENMAQRWAADVTTEIMNRASATVKAEEAEQARLAGEEIPNDPDPESTVTINNQTDGIALARELGAKQAGNTAAYKANMPHFVK